MPLRAAGRVTNPKVVYDRQQPIKGVSLSDPWRRGRSRSITRHGGNPFAAAHTWSSPSPGRQSSIADWLRRPPAV